MLGITITFLTFVLILITLFMMLVILMQRPNTNAGMGAAFGGGVTESTFGAETTNILTRATKWAAGAFFIFAIVLYMLYLIDAQPAVEEEDALPTIATETTDADIDAAVGEALAAAEQAAAEASATAPEVSAPEAANIVEGAEATAEEAVTTTEEALAEETPEETTPGE